MEVDNLSYSFDCKKMDAVSHFSALLPSHGIVSLIGPSGSGKTTLLRLLAGQLTPSTGQIIANHPCNLQEVLPPPEEKALLNYIAGPPAEGEDETTRANRLRELLDIFDLEAHDGKMLGELSQGELKRAHLARSLFLPPPILLLDEPFSGLEPQLTFSIQQTLREIAHREELLIIIATHHIREAMALSDQIIVMKDGQLIQQGPPPQIYHCPNNSFVAGLFGPCNLLTGRVVKIENYIRLETPLGPITCPNDHRQKLHQTILCYLCPEHLRPTTSLTSGLPCHIQKLYFWGAQTLCQLSCRGHTLYSSSIPAPTVGMKVQCEFAYGRGVILDDLATPQRR